MLEDVNNILNGGDVPNLYKTEDLEPIQKVGKQLCIEQGITVSKMNMNMAYLGRVCKNIHMIIAMSPLGGEFRTRIRQFPSLVTCCTIDWFNEWPEEALLGVGRGQILATDIDLGNDLDNCVEMFKYIHQSVEQKSVQFKDELSRHVYVTPTSFLEQLNMYSVILKQKKKQNNSDKNRLVTGLLVLEKAQKAIEQLKIEIDQKQPILARTMKDIEETVKELNVEREAA
jgi:dynein heavy chain, axonemal